MGIKQMINHAAMHPSIGHRDIDVVMIIMMIMIMHPMSSRDVM
jgi:hypothetical protein